LLPGMALVGSTVQYMGRVLGVLEVPGKHYLVLFGICILNAYLAMFVMSLLV
jgi:inner membrane protein yjiG